MRPITDIIHKAMTCDEDKPWKNEVFGDLIKAQWWGPKGDARRLGLSRENVYMEVPIQMLALVACAVRMHTISVHSSKPHLRLIVL